MKTFVRCTIAFLLVCLTAACSACTGGSKETSGLKLLGSADSIVYGDCRYVPLDGLSCWMWSSEGMTCVGKYKNGALFGNTATKVYAPADPDPRLYVGISASGSIRWLKEGFAFPSPLDAELTGYELIVSGKTYRGQCDRAADIFDTDAGTASGEGMVYTANLKLFLSGYGDTYFSGKLYSNDGKLYFCDEGYSGMYYPVTDAAITEHARG